MKQFLQVTGSNDMLERMESNNVWPLMEKEDTCPHAMLHLARSDSLTSMYTHIYCPYEGYGENVRGSRGYIVHTCIMHQSA